MSNALAQFTFEGSTDGLSFSAIDVTGTFIEPDTADNAYADWRRYSVMPTDPSSLGQLAALRIGMDVKSSGGATWHQQFGAVSLDQISIPEPSTVALVGLGVGAFVSAVAGECERIG